METHAEKINNYCRLCKKKILLSKGYCTAKDVTIWKESIKLLFDHDICEDDSTIFPSKLCSGCNRQMKRIILSESYECQDIAIFEPHNESCTMCHTGRLSHHSYSLIRNESPKMSYQFIKNIGINKGFSVQSDIGVLVLYHSCQQLGAVVVEKTIKIYTDFTWTLYIFNKEMMIENTPFLVSLPKKLNNQNIDKFLTDLKDVKVCKGNNDFQLLINEKIEEVDCKIGRSQIEGERLNTVKEEMKTIRSRDCDILVGRNSNIRCDNCQAKRDSLRIMEKRKQENPSSTVKKKRPHCSLKKRQLRKKLFVTKEENKNLKKKVRILEKRLEKCVKKSGVALDTSEHELVKTIITQADPSSFETNSPMFLLWQQQKKMSNLKKSTLMRWHPLLIRWALSIYLKSPGAYEHIRSTGFIHLPHRTTLNQYTNFTNIGCGYNPDIITRFCEEAKLDQLPESHKCCSLLFDEMKIQSGLVFSQKSGKLIGFSELGDMNKEIEDLDASSISRPLATHVLSVMARGLVSRFNYPIAYFATTTVSADQLFPIMWEGVRVMEMIGVRVEAFIADGASQNRKFFELHRDKKGTNLSTDGVVYWVANMYAPERKIYFISDPPHLLKTIRNNWERSNGTKGTRQLMVNGKSLSWHDIKDVYEWDLQQNSFSPGLRKLHKITHEHIYLSPRLRMRVNLAAQVLSKTMADTLSLQGLESTGESQKFLRMVDTFFDCLNVTQTFTGQKLRKDALKPYIGSDDWRFEWLERTFLKFINDWKNQTKTLGMLEPKEQAKRCLSYQTIEGIRMTVHSFKELVPRLLSFHDVDYFLSDRLNQDPIEEHFSKQRMRGGGIENPTLEQFMYNERKIIVAKSDMLLCLRGNTRGRKREQPKIDISNESELPKRKKKKQKR